ncbi:MAG: hypothetical protein ACYCZ0_03195 [Minisyncoccota bacterium]
MRSVGRKKSDLVAFALAQLNRLKERFPGDLDARQLAEVEREVRDIVMPGNYVGIAPGKAPVRFTNVGCKVGSRRLDDFFVEFAPGSGEKAMTLSVEVFLKTYRFFVRDYA